MENFQLPDIVGSQEEFETIPLEEVIVPDNIYASSGNGVYVKVYSGKRDLWQRGITEIRKFGGASSIFVGEITKEQYLELAEKIRIHQKIQNNIQQGENK